MWGLSHLSRATIHGRRRVRRVASIGGPLCSRKRPLFVEMRCWQRRLLPLLHLACRILEHRQKQSDESGLKVGIGYRNRQYVIIHSTAVEEAFFLSKYRLQQKKLASLFISVNKNAAAHGHGNAVLVVLDAICITK